MEASINITDTTIHCNGIYFSWFTETRGAAHLSIDFFFYQLGNEIHVTSLFFHKNKGLFRFFLFYFLRFVSGEMSTSCFKYIVYFSFSTKAPFSYLHLSRKLYFYRRTRVKPHRITPRLPILMKKTPVISVQYFGANLELDKPAWIRDNKGPRHILQPRGRCCAPSPPLKSSPRSPTPTLPSLDPP